MSDQLTGLGGNTNILRIAPDWSTEPSEEQEVSRNFFEFPGTRRTVLLLSDDSPAKISLAFSFDNKADAAEFLDFFNDMRGQWGAFWLPSPLQHFSVVGDYLAGADKLFVEKTNFMYNFADRERLYVKKNNGDLLTFQISAVEPGLSTEDPISLTLGEALAANLDNDEIDICGQLYFGRFDGDDLQVEWTTDQVCRCSVNFTELVLEYPT